MWEKCVFAYIYIYSYIPMGRPNSNLYIALREEIFITTKLSPGPHYYFQTEVTHISQPATRAQYALWGDPVPWVWSAKERRPQQRR
jgi:hypothetical protein